MSYGSLGPHCSQKTWSCAHTLSRFSVKYWFQSLINCCTVTVKLWMDGYADKQPFKRVLMQTSSVLKVYGGSIYWFETPSLGLRKGTKALCASSRVSNNGQQWWIIYKVSLNPTKINASIEHEAGFENCNTPCFSWSSLQIYLESKLWNSTSSVFLFRLITVRKSTMETEKIIEPSHNYD